VTVTARAGTGTGSASLDESESEAESDGAPPWGSLKVTVRSAAAPAPGVTVPASGGQDSGPGPVAGPHSGRLAPARAGGLRLAPRRHSAVGQSRSLVPRRRPKP
jgi:hypothetical protein